MLSRVEHEQSCQTSEPGQFVYLYWVRLTAQCDQRLHYERFIVAESEDSDQTWLRFITQHIPFRLRKLHKTNQTIQISA